MILGQIGGGQDDRIELSVGSDDGGIGWSVESDEWDREGGGDVEGSGIVADDEAGMFDEGGGLEEGGLVDKVDDYFLVGGVLEELLGGVGFGGAGAEEDGG